MTNAFESYAEVAKPIWRQKREGAAVKRADTLARKKTEQEEKLEEREALERGWKAWRRQQVAELLAGPHGKDVRGILSFVRTMTLSSAPALVELVGRATWAPTMSYADRQVLLRLIWRGIDLLAAREGLPPFTDGIPGDEPRAADKIKAILFPEYAA